MGTVDVLWNNAGIFQNVPAEDMNYAEWLRIIDINLNTVFAVSQAVAPHHDSQQKGNHYQYGVHVRPGGECAPKASGLQYCQSRDHSVDKNTGYRMGAIRYSR